MQKKSSIEKSIYRTLAAYGLFQWLFMGVLIWKYSLSKLSTIISFFGFSIGCHLSLVVFLLKMKHDFYNVSRDEPLDRINVSNLLSLFRLSSIPTVGFLIVVSSSIHAFQILIPFTSLVFLTDLLDGLIARKARQVTRIGKYLDSISDYGILIVISIVFMYYRLVPLWFFIIIMIRLSFQWIGMGILLLMQGKVPVVSTFFGKASVFATMMIYAVALLQLFPNASYFALTILPILQYVTSGIVIISLIEKAMLLRKHYKDAGI